jgi:exodeoxyribonuclease-5
MGNKILENQLKLPNGKIITFNAEQFEAVKKIKDWILRKNEKESFFVLAGYSGTGKTSVVKKILDWYCGGVVVSAPTHKAKRVIGNITGRGAETLHSLLGLRADISVESFNPNDPIFNPIAIPRITDHNFVIIDEASMINEDLYNLILDKVINSSTKVLFIGDPAQIPPVGEKISMVFHQTDFESIWLTKIERQCIGNPLLLVANDLRNNLNTIDGGFVRKTSLNENKEGVIFTLNKKEFRKMIFEKFLSDEYKKDIDYVKLLAWKNDTVMESNKIIRNELLKDAKDIVEVNDLLMGYRSVSDAKQRYNIVENSADYKIVKKSKIEKNVHGIWGYRIKLEEKIKKDEFNYQNIFIINSEDENNLHNYAEMHDVLKYKAKLDKRLWSKYYEFRRENFLMTDIDKYRNGTARNKFECIGKDIDYGYALTIHKSQGSTYKFAMILETDINQNWLIKERNQIKYVAFTRPEISATILTTKIDE